MGLKSQGLTLAAASADKAADLLQGRQRGPMTSVCRPTIDVSPISFSGCRARWRQRLWPTRQPICCRAGDAGQWHRHAGDAVCACLADYARLLTGDWHEYYMEQQAPVAPSNHDSESHATNFSPHDGFHFAGRLCRSAALCAKCLLAAARIWVSVSGQSHGGHDSETKTQVCLRTHCDKQCSRLVRRTTSATSTSAPSTEPRRAAQPSPRSCRASRGCQPRPRRAAPPTAQVQQQIDPHSCAADRSAKGVALQGAVRLALAKQHAAVFPARYCFSSTHDPLRCPAKGGLHVSSSRRVRPGAGVPVLLQHTNWCRHAAQTGLDCCSTN